MTALAAMEEALCAIPAPPNMSEFGHARVDCALVHMDYFSLLSDAERILSEAIAEATGETSAEVFARLGNSRPCDCGSCIGVKAATEAGKRARSGYTNVKAFVEEIA